MAGNLTEVAQWELGVPYFEAGAVLTGGPDCPDNVPIQALANRSAYLKAQIESALGGTAGMPGHLQAANPHPQYVLGTALPAAIDNKLSAGMPSTPTGSIGTEIATADYVRAQILGAGKNADGIRTNRLLAAGTDPHTVLESGDYEFDGTTSPNMPTTGLVYVQMSVYRHSNTGGGSYVFAVLEIKDFYTNRRWECRATTSSGVVSFSAWTLIGGGGQQPTYTPVDVTSLRDFNTTYTNTLSTPIFVVSNFGLVVGQTVTVFVNGVSLQALNPNTNAGSFPFSFPVPAGGSYAFTTSTGGIFQGCVEFR